MMRHIKMNLKNSMNIGSKTLFFTLHFYSLFWKVMILIDSHQIAILES